MKTVITILLLCAPFAAAQGTHRLGQVLARGSNASANVVPYAQIFVCTAGTSCASQASIYQDINLDITQKQPVVADASGNYGYYVAAGCYDELISAPSVSPYYVYNVCLSTGGGVTPPASQNFLGSNSSSALIASPYTPVNKAGDTMTGPLYSQNSTDYFPGSKNDIRAFGAKCDGSTDDTADIQNAIYQECGGGGYTANYEPVFVPATVNGCLVTHSLAAGNCPGFTMIGAPSGSLGHTGQASRLLHALVEAYPVLDVSGDPGGLLENFSIQPEGGSVANSQATAGWYARPTTTYEGGGIQVHNVQSIAGNAAGSVGCAAIQQDLGSVDQGSMCSGGYGGGVFGDVTGTSTVASKFYTFGTGYGVTHFTISDSSMSGSLDYPLELTGTSGNFTIDHNSYITTILNPSGGAATAAAGIYLDSQSGAGGCIDGGNWRVENQGNSATYTGILIGANGATTCRFNATLGAGTYAITLTGSAVISNSNFMLATPATNIFAASGGSIINTTVYAADSAGHLGTVYQSRNFHVYGTLADDPRTTYTTYIATTAYHYNDVICDYNHASAVGSLNTYCVTDYAPYNMVSNVQIPTVSSQATTGISLGPGQTTAFFYNTGSGSNSGNIVYGPAQYTSSSTLIDVLMGNTATPIPVRFNFHDYNAAGSYIYTPAGQQIGTSTLLCTSTGTNCPSSSTTSTITTASAVTVATSTGYYFNQEATAAAAVTYTLPAPTTTSQLCFKNSNNGSAANTGTLELLVANTGTQSIDYNGTKTSSGYVISGGAAGDGGCLVGISTTVWELYSSGTTVWTVH